MNPKGSGGGGGGVKDKAMVKEQRANRCRQRALGVTDTVATVLLISSKVRKSHVL